MPLILGAQSATTAAAVVSNSCRFNIPDGSELAATLGTPTDQDTWTCSFWFKPTSIGEHGVFDAHGDASNYGFYELGTNGQLTIFQKVGGATTCVLVTKGLFLDFSAWYHIVVVWDSGNATEADRVIVYKNGTRVLAFSTETYPAQDANSAMNSAVEHNIGRKDTNDAHNYDGYLAEFVFIDGTVYAASDFGEFDEDSPTIWKPKKVSGLTFGDNGFYLDFEDSADLGADVSGNSHDFTATALTASDQSQDCPSNNFCIMNALDDFYPDVAFTDGNNTIVTTNTPYAPTLGTIGLTAGKWYWETRYDASSGSDWLNGLCGKSPTNATTSLGASAQDYAYIQSGGVVHDGSNTSSGYDALSSGTGILGVYLDIDNSKLYFGVDGTIQNSGTGIDIVALSTLTIGAWFPAFGDGGAPGNATASWNFGNGCFGTTAVTSSNTDANGYGLFEYDPSDGGSASFDGSAKDFLAICTENLGSDGG